jgi:hypothetical protein
MKKNSKKLDLVKVPGKGNLNQQTQVFEDKRTKRKRTRQAKKDQALQDQLDKP